jgi:hypothetical protein
MAALSGTILASRIVPTDSLDEFATHDEFWGRGGHRSCVDITERDAITTQRRKEGMTVYVTSTGKEYRLVNGIANSDWVEVTSSGDSEVAELEGMFKEAYDIMYVDYESDTLIKVYDSSTKVTLLFTKEITLVNNVVTQYVLTDNISELVMVVVYEYKDNGLLNNITKTRG